MFFKDLKWRYGLLRANLSPTIGIFRDHVFATICWVNSIASHSTSLFVAFFSCGKDAMDEYRKYLPWLRARILRQSNNSSKLKGSFFVMQSSTLVIFLSRCVRALLLIPAYYKYRFKGHPRPCYLKFQISLRFWNNDCDTHSEVTTHYSSPPFGECKAIGSYTDIALCSLTTLTSFSTSHEIPEVEPTHPWLHRLSHSRWYFLHPIVTFTPFRLERENNIFSFPPHKYCYVPDEKSVKAWCFLIFFD